MLVVDAMNVRGAVPDGWWRDRDGALVRLVEAIAAHDFDGEWVVVVADGRPVPGLPAGTRGEVELRYAGHGAPDAADDDIVALVHELAGDGHGGDDPVTVVTSDRGLIARLPPGTPVVGARTFRQRLGPLDGGGGRGREG